VPELLIVDDDDALRRWEERAVRRHLRWRSYELALLNVNIPGESGIDLLSQIRSNHPTVAILMVTGEDSTQLAMTAIELGAYGYLVKPVGSGELLINVANALHRRRRELENRRLVQRLRATVDERSLELEEALQDLGLSETKVWVSQAETIFRLARLVEFRDEETGHHLHRMSSYCEIVARQMGLSERRGELVRLASQLHDVGKVVVPDSILLKHGKLTPEEFEMVKGHAETGFQMLAGSASEVVQLGALIARTHHERWDGSGYPRGLAGGEIPLEGRIAAVADVFDALTSDRVYRSALPGASAIGMMQDKRASHFDPEPLDAFLGSLAEVEAVRQAYGD
jgi:cyclic di-GMP phosphodiesterase